MPTNFPRFSSVATSSLLAFLVLLLFAGPARALTVEVTHAGPSLVGQAHTFTASVPDASGEVTFEWRFGDMGDFVQGGAEMSHVFEAPGLYSIDVSAVDAAGSSGSYYARHLVHYPLTPERPSSSTSIVYDPERNRVYTVNQDNDTLTVIDPQALTSIAELPVYRRPVSLMLTPQGKLWVVHQDDYAVAVVDLDNLLVERGFRLPYASQPVGIALSPLGDAAYVTLLATGKLLKLDPNTGDSLGEVDTGPRPRGVAVTHDGSKVYVTRFTSPNDGGEVIKVDAATLTVDKRISLPLDSDTVDSDQQARGLPNYLFAVALTPDGRQAWVPGKKDNIGRGRLLDGQELTHDTLVRPLTSIIDTQVDEEIYDQRIDLDDRSPPVHVEFTPYGNFAILSLAGSNRIEVRDVTNPTQVFSAIGEVGTFPLASVLLPQGLLFVQAALSRNVLVYDMTALLESFDQSTPPRVAEIPTVGSEKLALDVLEGKKLFNNAEDTRMAFEGYISCGACHFDGIDDGRVFDFSSRGEGLRNTLSLIGTGQGRLNWTGTFDEVQDFEHQIRDLFDGTGFIADDVLNTGTYGQPLGDSKKGLSPELDALDAYVRSLDQVNPSPFRNPDGTLTADAVVGKALFEKIGCDFCHGGPGFSDSERGRLHDVGTFTENSGTRLGEPLRGFDTPTLLGVWETPPYLHDGSAATLRDVLTTRNPEDRHGLVSVLSAEQIDQLVAYLLQIDGELGVRTLPFEAPQPAPPAPAAVSVEIVPSFGLPTGVPAQVPSPGVTAPTTDAPPVTPQPSAGPQSSGQTPTSAEAAGCNVSRGPGGERSGLALLLCLLGAVLTSSRRQRRWLTLGWCFGCLPWVYGCGEQATTPGDDLQPTTTAPTTALPSTPTYGDWSALPAVVDADHELAALGSREATFSRICGRGHNDAFARALCGGGQPPPVRNLTDLLALAGLGEDRAFALTGNSTSVVAKHVSAVNPRLIVFPRVGADLQRPETMTAVGFVRGEQFVEVVSRDLVTDDYNFYLFAFEQSCNYEGTGCDLASLLSEEIEHDWTAYSVYDHVDLEPTSLDCLSCHQMGPPGTRRILRMQELTGPWLHWFPQRFGQRTESDRVLTAQFADAHRVDSQYGGIAMATLVNAIDEGSAAQLESLVRAEGSEQPNQFDGHIVQEVAEGASPTWEARFKAHLRGEAIAVPYPLMDVTDAAKRAAAVQSYVDVVSGVAPRESLLDLRDVFTEDAKQKLSFVPPPGADGKTILLQMCARCHDGRGDPTLTKNRFNVLQLDSMSATEKALAIARLNADDHTRMPPRRVGTLSTEAISAATAELQK